MKEQEPIGTSAARETGAADARESATGSGRPTPQMQDVLDMLASLGAKPIPSLSAEEAREQPTPADAVGKLLAEQGRSTDPEPVGRVDDRTIPGPAGDIAVRVYSPEGEGPFPVLVYYHGGGWVIADLDTYDASARALCNAVGSVVLSVHYRQAPEHRFPAAHEDCYAAYKWAREHADDIGGDAGRVAVCGESAGGNLAAVVCINARDEGFPLPAHQVLVYPIADSRTDSPSYREQADAKPLDRPMMEWFLDKYLRTPADGDAPAIALARTADLAGLPPTTVINAELDPLRSEGERLAERLRTAGVPVEQRTYPGVTHEFFGMAAVVDAARDAQTMAAGALRRALGTS